MVAPFVLYLRPFSTERLFVSNIFKSGMILTPSYHIEDSEIALSALITKLCDPLPVIQFGGSPENAGPGKIVVDDEYWREKLLMLLPRARSIVMGALYGPATAWEAEQIASRGYLFKTTFVLPRSCTASVVKPMQDVFERITLNWPASGEIFWYDEVGGKQVLSESRLTRGALWKRLK